MDQFESGVMDVLKAVLGPAVFSHGVDQSTPLLGAVAELDSMAVVAILTAIEEHFGIGIPDDEVDSSTFATVGTLVEFVRAKAAA
jgi:acyl carrier protein